MARGNGAFEMDEIDVGIDSNPGRELEKIIWDHAKQVHHIANHDTSQSTEQNECPECTHLATAHQVNMTNLKVRHQKPNYPTVWKPEKPTSTQLFESKYCNKSEKKQMFSFKTTKHTTSRATIELKNPVTYGQGGCNLLLKLPEELAEQNIPFGKDLQVTKATEEFKEELEWSVDNLIECPPKKTTRASLIISEHQYAAKFTVDTIVWGKVLVTLREQDRRAPSFQELDIVEVLREFETTERQDFFKIEKNKVMYTTEGKCKFNYGVEQYITVETVKKSSCTIL